MKTVFDIGANNGESTLGMINSVIYAFEPTPELCEKLRKYESPTYHVIQKAVSDFNGKATFYVAGQSDWGCSSLYEFSDNLDTTWLKRKDFKVTKEIEVDVIRLDTFIEENKIQDIDYFHCDAQGSDLKVLKGLGKYISIVEEGMIEVAKKDFELYKNTDNLLEDATAFLISKGFTIHGEPCNQEYDITFTRRLC